MALVGINPVSSEPRKPSTLENVALAFQIANNAVGAGVAIPKLITEMGIAKREKELRPYETLSGLQKNMKEVPQGTPGSTEMKHPVTKGMSYWVAKEDEDVPPQWKEITKGLERDAKAGWVTVPRKDARTGITVPTRIRSEGVKPGEKLITTGEEWYRMGGQSAEPRSAGVVVQLQGQSNQVSQFDETKYQGKLKDLSSELGDIKAKYSERIEAGNRGREMLKDGSAVSAAVAGAAMARGPGAEKGVLTDKDIIRYFPSSAPGQIGKFVNWLNGQQGEVLTPNEVAAMNRAFITADRLNRMEMSTQMVNAHALWSKKEPDFANHAAIKDYFDELKEQTTSPDGKSSLDKALQIKEWRKFLRGDPPKEQADKARAEIKIIEDSF